MLKTTTFICETCGKISDVGYIYNEIGNFKVYQVRKYKTLYLHLGVLLQGCLFIYNNVNIYLDKVVRYKISIHHTVMHLVNAMFKRVLNIKLVNKGFFINSKTLTFDFNNYKNLSNRTLFIIEQLLNNEFITSTIILKKQTSKQLKKNIQLNLVVIGNEGSFSIEICNGMHIKTTRTIGCFCIVSDKTISKGRRRIVALTNKNAIHYVLKNLLIIKNISYNIKQNIKNIENNIKNILNKQKIYLDYLKHLKQKKRKQIIKMLLDQTFYIFDYKILFTKIKLDSKKDLLFIINKIATKLVKKSIIILYGLKTHFINVFIKVTKDCLKLFTISCENLKNFFKTKQTIICITYHDLSYIKTCIKSFSICFTKTVKTIIQNILIKYK
ncbi:Alanyl-tRNA editing protein [Candidatus Portiera aleyrodidarum]|uniref:Alanyl-tRNA editing protein n=2 Tax=Candidatus Portiera aleyrodidarum TaxID=91844 RepID=A0A6S6S570_9GAMM|nr:Alanyl-tRNA editing protein [Candidatus Portiera aleyrodidarum]